MRSSVRWIAAMMLLAGGSVAVSQSTPASTAPTAPTAPTVPTVPAPTAPATTRPSADAVLDRLLGPSDSIARPIAPQPRPGPAASGADAAPTVSSGVSPGLSPGVSPGLSSGIGAAGASTGTIQREGTFVVDRMGRLSRSADGRTWEFAFESDGVALSDPPVVLIPNLKLMSMEDAISAANQDLRFRVTGMLTEYRGRNHLMLEKVVVVQGR